MREGACGWLHPDSGTHVEVPEAWNPFLYAEDDVQVLARVREVWLAPDATLGSPLLWPLTRFHGALMSELDSHGHGGPRFLSYHVGDYARAALAVLKEMEEKP